MRNFPTVDLSPCLPSYARLAAQGYDTVQEALNVELSPKLVRLLEDTKRAALAASKTRNVTVECDLNGQKFQAHAAGGRGGFLYRLSNDDFILMFRNFEVSAWNATVRYKSAGLWEHGWEPLCERIHDALRSYVRPRDRDFVRLTRGDYCFDFLCPSFAGDFKPSLAENTVFHSSTKAELVAKLELWTRGPRGETLTIGSKSGLEVSLYDKLREIIEASGKTWLYDVWKRGLGYDPWPQQKPTGIWRLECRFGPEFLKDRNVRRPHQFKACIAELISEALFTRRLTQPRSTDLRRDRHPLHPFWSEAIRQCDATAMVPIGRKVTERRETLLQMSEKQIAGCLRSASVLRDGGYRESNVIDLMERARARIEADPHHAEKVEAARNRYSDVDEAK